MIKDFQTLLAYQKAFRLAVKIHTMSCNFPKEEKYALADQIRRSSRSICANIAEAYRKRLFPKHFISKLTDADSETAETMVWLDFSLEFLYLDLKEHKELSNEYEEVGRLLNYMMANPSRFLSKT